MHWSQSVSTSKFSLGRHSPSVPKKTQATFLGPEFRVPFHLVKNQVEVFRCEAHISLLGMLISGWAAISIFESSWGGASKSCLALRKRRRNWALTSIFWLALSVFLSMWLYLTFYVCFREASCHVVRSSMEKPMRIPSFQKGSGVSAIGFPWWLSW